MKAVRFHGAGDVRVEQVDGLPAPGPGRVLLRVRTVGICGTDGLEFKQGPVLVRPLDTPHPVTGHLGPLTLGHEFAGEITAVGDGVDEFEPGMLVACGAGMSCGTCAPCRDGRTNLCTTYATIGFHQDGGLAEAVLAPAAICFDAGSYGLSADAAALAQPMAIAVHAARRGRVANGELVAIIGVGGIGSFLTYAASAMGATVVVADTDPVKLEIAAALGAARTVDVTAGETLQAALDRAPDVIFEASGAAVALEQAVRLAPRGGRIVAVGVQKAPPPVDMARLTLDELELIGTVAHVVAHDFPEALRLLAAREAGWADVAPEVLPLDDVLDAGIRPLANGSSDRIKALFDPSAPTARPARY